VTACAGALLAAHCGGSALAPTAPPEVTVTITATGVSPVEVRIPVVGRVNFANGDTRPHAMASDPVASQDDRDDR
jgi:hypothetical protein